MDQAQHLRNIIKQKNPQPVSRARVITITSGKGGVGKSNTAVNLAVQLQKKGKKVIIFDADFGLANVEVMFGAVPKYNLSDVIYRGKKIQEIITPGPMDIGFISGGSGITGVNNLTKDQIMVMVENLKELDSLADVILIDTGAGISDSVLEFVLKSPEVLLVITPDLTSLTDAYSLLKTLHKNPEFRKEETEIKVICNKVINAADGQAVYGKLNSIVGQFLDGKLLYLGMIPRDLEMDKAMRQRTPISLLTPDAKSSKAFARLADSLVNGNECQKTEKRGIMQLFSHLMNKRM